MKFQRQNARVNESLMGWTATSDPTGNLTLSFPDDTTAIAFAQRNGTFTASCFAISYKRALFTISLLHSQHKA